MNYYKIILFINENEEREILVNEDVAKQVQQALSDGAEYINLGDKGMFKRSYLKGIFPANEIVKQYQDSGMQIDGLLEPVKQKALYGNVKSAKEVIKDRLVDMRKWAEQQPWWKKGTLDVRKEI